MESKVYSWKFVTADELLTQLACELVYAHLVPLSATITTILYNGVDTNGQKIVQLHAATSAGMEFSPPIPVYCERGLYVDVGADATGVFVMWRNLGHKSSG